MSYVITDNYNINMKNTDLKRTGFCNCGCGTPTKISSKTNATLGHIAGEPVFFVSGHSRRINFGNLPYLETDTGYETPCHLWRRRIGPKSGGYAYWSTLGGTRNSLVHRAVWEHANGPAPEGWQIHHKCRVRHCVRVDHLEALPTYAHKQAEIAATLREVDPAPVDVPAGAALRLAELWGLA